MLQVTWHTNDEGLSDETTGDTTSQQQMHVLEFDCVLSEVAKVTSVVTKHAIELGSRMADHKRLQVETITLEAVVTNTPLGEPGFSGTVGTTDIGGSGGSVQATETGANVFVFDQEFDRVVEVRDVLWDLSKKAILVDIMSSVANYNNVTLIDTSAPRKGTDSITFTLTFEALNIASTDIIDVPLPREPRASSSSDSGAQEGAERDSSHWRRFEENYEARRANGEGRIDAARNAAAEVFG